MSPSRTEAWSTYVGTGLALASLALTVDNLRRIRVPGVCVDQDAERVAVLLPVRDEERVVGACLTAVLAAADSHPGPVDVLVLDDGSSDATARLVAEVAASDPRVRLLTGEPTPPGWLGKPWACHQLALAADGLPHPPSVLVFVDADVELRPVALAATVGLLRDAGLQLICPYPHQRASSAAERLVQPLLVWSWASTLPLGPAERSPRPSLSAANGQLLAIDTAAYRRCGGHAAVRHEVIEDVALLRALKRSGGRGVVADGSRVADCRMYDGWPALRAGYRKSLWSAFGSPAGAVGALGLLLTAYVVPPVAALTGSRVGLVGYAAGVAGRVMVARRWGTPVADALAHPVSVLLFAGLTVDSFVGRRRGSLVWKDRPLS